MDALKVTLSKGETPASIALAVGKLFKKWVTAI
jgi:hypothetical protein